MEPTFIGTVQILTLREKVRDFLIAVSLPGAIALADGWHPVRTLPVGSLCVLIAALAMTAHAEAHLRSECAKLDIDGIEFKRTSQLMSKQGGVRFAASYRGAKSRGVFMRQGGGRIDIKLYSIQPST